MYRKTLFATIIALVLLAFATVLALARSQGDGFNQSGIDMTTATPPMEERTDQATVASPMGNSMMQGTAQPHIIPLPGEYETYTNTVTADEASLNRGAALYSANCSQCHGANGMGGGMAADLNPPAPEIALTSQMLTDAYLFFRISEGGAAAPFNSAMPSWKSSLSETDRWDLVNYVRSLSSASGSLAGQAGGCGMTGSSMSSGCVQGSSTLTDTVGMGAGNMDASSMDCPMLGKGGMSGMDMSGMNMQGSGMQGMNMSGMDMSGMNIQGQGSNMQGMNMSGGMSGMDMSGMNMQGQSSNMPGTNTTGDMAGMDMSGSNLPGVSVSALNGLAEVEEAPWYSNPWNLLGWALLGLVALGFLSGVIAAILWLFRRPRQTAQAIIE